MGEAVVADGVTRVHDGPRHFRLALYVRPAQEEGRLHVQPLESR